MNSSVLSVHDVMSSVGSSAGAGAGTGLEQAAANAVRTRTNAVAAVFVSVAASAAVAQQAQGRYVAPKTSWGDPDLQEIWSTEDLRDIPYERPDEVQGRTLLTDQEFAEREATTKRAASRGQTGFGNGSKTRAFRQTSLIAGDGKYPALDRKSTRLNSSHVSESRMPSSA